MVAAGTRVFLPEIPGVGVIRQRYPMFPVHSEGSTTEKNLAALQVHFSERNKKRYSSIRLSGKFQS